MSAEPEQKWTPEQYLAFERASETKHEYIDGEVVAMVGGSPRHSAIAASTIATIDSQLGDRPCIVYTSDLRIKVPRSQMYAYPDMSVACGDAEFEEDMLLNPTVLVEVLSPSTERYDRGSKFLHYQKIPSLQDYVLISQDAPRIECYTRHSDGSWHYVHVAGLEGVIALSSIGCTLDLAAVYRKVVFEESEDT
jgi:Uma2 family endonuclease